jgi:hypothetical protein
MEIIGTTPQESGSATANYQLLCTLPDASAGSIIQSSGVIFS